MCGEIGLVSRLGLKGVSFLSSHHLTYQNINLAGEAGERPQESLSDFWEC